MVIELLNMGHYHTLQRVSASVKLLSPQVSVMGNGEQSPQDKS